MSDLTITVLGSGCAKCKKLHELTQVAAAELGLNIEVEYCTDVEKIIEIGAMSSPVLAINGKPVMEGSLPDSAFLKELIAKHTSEAFPEKECCSDNDRCDISCSAQKKEKSGGCCCGSC